MHPSINTALLVLFLMLGFAFVPSSYAEKVQSFLSVEGTRIVDSGGHQVILRGVNYPGYQSESDDPIPHSESAYQTFARSGFNVVRLPISWGNLEPYPGMFCESYLASYVDRDIRWAKKFGVYIVLDMHQDRWASDFGGTGAPDWTVNQYPPTEDGLVRAVSEFWNNTSLQDHLIRVWTKIAERYAKEPTLAGYDILNEPWIYNSVIPNLSATHVNDFYMNAIRSIRTVDTNHIVFLEPANMQASGFPLKDAIVWSPHFYTLSFAIHYDQSNVSLLKADIAAKYQEFVVEMGSPIWIGEFGAFMKDQSSEQWLRDTMALFSKYQIGWAWWAYSLTAGRSTFASLMKAFYLSMTSNSSRSVSSQPLEPPKVDSKLAQLSSSNSDQSTSVVGSDASNPLLLCISVIASFVIGSSNALRRHSAI